MRFKWRGGRLYFIVNSSQKKAALSLPAGAVALDAMTGEAKSRDTVELAPAGSIFVWLENGEIGVAKAPRKEKTAVALDGEWKLDFTDDVSGWPLPQSREGDVLGDWTRFGECEAEFSGAARYRTVFALDAVRPEGLMLDLGEVCNSARVKVNGRFAGTLFMHPYRLALPAEFLREGENELEIEVANLGANRIRTYDRKGVEWKIFHNANVMGFGTGRLLHAENWPVLPSGLIGPVKIVSEKIR